MNDGNGRPDVWQGRFGEDIDFFFEQKEISGNPGPVGKADYFIQGRHGIAQGLFGIDLGIFWESEY